MTERLQALRFAAASADLVGVNTVLEEVSLSIKEAQQRSEAARADKRRLWCQRQCSVGGGAGVGLALGACACMQAGSRAPRCSARVWRRRESR